MSAIGGAATFATNMGLASAYENKSEASQTQAVSFPAMGAREQQLVKQLGDLGLNQAKAIRVALSLAQGTSFALAPEDKASLNRVFDAAGANLRRQGYLMGQDLAGTRGLNPSDTPVSEAVLRETLPALASLEGGRASQELGLGLQAKQLRLQGLLTGAQTSPLGLTNALDRLARERFGRTTVSSTGTYSPGFLDRMATAGGAQRDITQAGSTLMGGGAGSSGSMGIGQIGAMFA